MTTGSRNAGEHVDATLPLTAAGDVSPVVGRSWPAQLGPWRIVGELGRGGMGWVLLGERADGAYEQRVAVKVLDPNRVGSREGIRSRAHSNGGAGRRA